MKLQAKCESVINQLITKGFLIQVNQNSLDAAIIHALGVCDKRTLANIRNALTTLEYLTETAPHVYRLNLQAIQEKATLEALKTRQVTLKEAQAGVTIET